jgi:NAD(P) transhydrogenase subunit beta
MAAVGLGAVFAVRIGGADMPVLISFLNATAGLAAAFCGLAIQNRLLIAAGATVVASGSILTHIMCKGMNRSLAAIFTGLPTASGRRDDGPAPAREPDALRPPAPARAEAVPAVSEDPLARAFRTLRDAATVIIVPGYGMALAEAQFETVELAEKLESTGKMVRFAIHPVAGRMPGHMHVLLAEAEVDYRKLAEIDAINAEFKDTDVALIVGACDVVNPAAIRTTGTPISGMPILLAHEARAAVVCNLDEKPGYSGVENPLYRDPRTIMLNGDAKERLRQLIDRFS